MERREGRLKARKNGNLKGWKNERKDYEWNKVEMTKGRKEIREKRRNRRII